MTRTVRPRRKKKKTEAANGAAAWLAVVKIGQSTVRELAVIGAQLEQITTSMNASALAMQRVAIDLASATPRTEAAVVELKEHVSAERGKIVGTVLSEGASLRSTIRPKRLWFAMGLLAMLSGATAQAIGQFKPFFKSVWGFFVKP